MPRRKRLPSISIDPLLFHIYYPLITYQHIKKSRQNYQTCFSCSKTPLLLNFSAQRKSPKMPVQDSYVHLFPLFLDLTIQVIFLVLQNLFLSQPSPISFHSPLSLSIPFPILSHSSLTLSTPSFLRLSIIRKSPPFLHPSYLISRIR